MTGRPTGYPLTQYGTDFARGGEDAARRALIERVTSDGCEVRQFHPARPLPGPGGNRRRLDVIAGPA